MDDLNPALSSAQLLLALGGMFLLGVIADLIGRYSPIPRVSLLLLAGIAIGPSGLAWLPSSVTEFFPLLTTVALTMVGFLLGQKLTFASMRKLGRQVLCLSIAVVLASATAVIAVSYALGAPFPIALLLGGIATATDPAATLDVVRQFGRHSRFSEILLDVVAIDDVWGVILFSIALSLAQALVGVADTGHTVIAGFIEIAGAIVVGLAVGIPAAFLTGRIRPGEPTQAEALGIVLIAAGLAQLIGASYILAAVTLGATVTNLARHHKRPFVAIEGLEWPFLILFFLLAGASLQLSALSVAGVVGLGYVLARVMGRLAGGHLGAWWADRSATNLHHLGLAMLPQGGVAIGLALLASQRFPEFGGLILSVTLASTVLFEIIGPIATKTVMRRVNGLEHSKN